MKDKIITKGNLRRGRGNRNSEEKRVGNNYLGCNYKR